MSEEYSAAWTEALARLARRRSSPILMPAALLAALDVLDGQGGASDEIPFPAFEVAFDARVEKVSARKRGLSWQPFFHLAGSAGLWDLMKGAAVADFSDLARGRPRSRAALVARVDRARMRSELIARGPSEVKAIREAVASLLANDPSEEARALSATVGP